MTLDHLEYSAARFVSWLFHPLLLPLYVLLLLLSQDYYFILILTPQAKWFLIGLVSINTLILPALLMLLYKRSGIISSYQMKRKEERFFPYITMMVFYYLTHYLISGINLPAVFYLFITGATFLVVAVFLINFVWKISVHMCASGAAAGTFTGLAYMYLLPAAHIVALLLLIGGITGFARLKLEAHSPAQVYAGYFLGFLVLFASFLLF